MCGPKALVRTHSILPSHKQSLFSKKREKLTTNILITIMKTKQLNQMQTKGTETTQVHETKHVPFVVVEITKTDDQDNEEKVFKVGAMGHFMSEKNFKTLESAEKYVNARPWDLITNLICLLIQNANEYEKSQSNN